MYSAHLLRLSCVAAVILAGAGCSSTPTGGSGSRQQATTKPPTARVAPASVLAMPSDYRYVCDLVPLNAVRKAVGRSDLVPSPLRTGNAQSRTDGCQYMLQGSSSSDQASQVLWVGVGVTKVTPAGLAPSSKTALGKRTPAPELGTGAFTVAQTSSAYFLVKGRLVIVMAESKTGAGRAQLLATAKLFATAVPRVEPAPTRITLPACDPLEPLAATALGGAVTVRRDSRDEEGLHCDFATDETSVMTTVSTSATDRKSYLDNVKYKQGMEPVPGLTNAVYESGWGLALLSPSMTAKMVLFPKVPDDAKAIALFKAVVKLKRA